ncbi:fluoride efflux transporter CrcB [Streptomyces corynorhini]|uniref:Fluoride-specific ion channel FluC n=1 Tax=Streptomyces corynorhini TaxID=2282652 RepID=A0A370B934_9ACTN|nr:fluoride efflux transporter CrcB [Streptomyces corynorhini]RDG36246.1 fluoride efflux transporter CrcB [Streptomyces corynorhini]
MPRGRHLRPGFPRPGHPRRKPPRERVRDQWRPVAVVALGGAIGASARYAASLIWPTAPGAFPWTTLIVNAAGCAVIGVFMVVITELWRAHPLVRPFFGTGVLGGFTTFSTYAVDIQRLVADGRARTGLAYLGLTLIAAFCAVWGAVWLTRRVLTWRQT